jgi:septal ring factor EnvC (AmiA/AmiB activator)
MPSYNSQNQMLKTIDWYVLCSLILFSFLSKIEELERIKLQNGRLARENDQIKKIQFDGKDALIAEIQKRDEYIKAANEHHAKAYENLKEKASAEITAKSSMVTMLNGKVKELMEERAQYTEKISRLRDKHAQESSDLIKKMTQLVEERNRLINTNLSQKQMIEDLMKRIDGKENSHKVNEDRLRHLMSTFESMERHKNK